MLNFARKFCMLGAFCLVPSVIVFSGHLANTRPTIPDSAHVIRMTSHGENPYFVTVTDRNTLIALALTGLVFLFSAVFLDVKWRGSARR